MLGEDKPGYLFSVNGMDLTTMTKEAAVKKLASAHYRLAGNIDFSTTNISGFQGIGSIKNPFMGVFDGHWI